MSEAGDRSWWADATAPLPDGRKLGYCGYGDPEGPPVFHFHGALTSRWEGFWLAAAARARGIRLISVDRPGVGNSDPRPGRRIADWAEDVGHLATHLGHERFTVLGVSGGGPYALACGVALGARIERVVLIAGAAQIAVPEVYDMFSFRQRCTLGSLMGRPRLLRAVISGFAKLPDLLRVLAITATLGGLSPADRRLLMRPDIRHAVTLLPPDARNAPFGKIGDGPAWDGELHAQPWGFDPASIRAPVDLWYGDDDRIIPASMGRWLARAMPHATLRVAPGEGHLSLILGRADEYLGAIAATARSTISTPVEA